MPVGNQSDRVTDVSILPPPPSPPPPGVVISAVVFLVTAAVLIALGLVENEFQVLAAVGGGFLVAGLTQLAILQLQGNAQTGMLTIRLAPGLTSPYPEELNTADPAAKLYFTVWPATGPGTGTAEVIEHPTAGKDPKTTFYLDEKRELMAEESQFEVNEALA